MKHCVCSIAIFLRSHVRHVTESGLDGAGCHSPGSHPAMLDKQAALRIIQVCRRGGTAPQSLWHGRSPWIDSRDQVGLIHILAPQSRLSSWILCIIRLLFKVLQDNMHSSSFPSPMTYVLWSAVRPIVGSYVYITFHVLAALFKYQ